MELDGGCFYTRWSAKGFKLGLDQREYTIPVQTGQSRGKGNSFCQGLGVLEQQKGGHCGGKQEE